ncbi:hypothetical protein Goshw_018229 [Gossypium schwendimanii]|uniref:Uncharacterized protein n=1 Tax=Gossypium schwendimanii TaxID=34291 RepID=A0A7J9KSY8_GOSSC|nr:hypothetical protein [Gossypium schwendimanii]
MGSDLEEQRRKTIFDGLLPVTGGKFEGDIEKKLRETGEWIGTTTEATFRSSALTLEFYTFSQPSNTLLAVAFRSNPHLAYVGEEIGSAGLSTSTNKRGGDLDYC